MTTVILLISLLLPAVWAARETSRNLQCTEHLHQIGFALYSYEKNHRTLPAGWTLEPTGSSGYGWAATLLPELGEDELAVRIDRSQPIGKADPALRRTTPAIYRCPSDLGAPDFTLFAEVGKPGANAQQSTNMLVTLPRANYMGVFGINEPDEVPGNTGEGVFIEGRGFRFAELSRGLDHLLMVGERTTRKMPSTWLGLAISGEDAGGRIVGCAATGPNRSNTDECEFDSRHYGHANFVWADGHVTGVEDDIDQRVYQECAQRAHKSVN